MSGAFQTSREIFNNPIWKNITEFRIFFLIYGNAIFAEEGYRVSEDLLLERGQWLRSTRKLQDDLTFIDNRQVKKYSTATINRCIKSLVQLQRICTKTHELGTVFTVLNYELYQGFGGYKKDNLEQNLEHSRNSNETVTKQRRNNNKKENKEKKVKEEVIKTLYADRVSLSDDEHLKLLTKYGTEEIKWAIEKLSNYKCSKDKEYKSDYHVLIGWVFDEFEKKKLTVVQGGGNSGKFGRPNEALSRTSQIDEDQWESNIIGSPRKAKVQ